MTGDSVYGADYALRRCIEKGGRGYVPAVTSRQRLRFKTVAEWLEDIPAKAWQRLRAGEGAKGPRLYDWVHLPCGWLEAPDGWQKGLLIRRKPAQPEGCTFHLTLAPEAAGLSDLVRVAGTRWTIERAFEAAKGEVGLDQYEVRSWNRLASPHHAGDAGACLSRRAPLRGGRGKGMVDLNADRLPLTVPEVRRLLWHLVWPGRLIARPRAPGRAGDAATSSEPAKATGNDELPLKPGCSTCTACGFWDTGLNPTQRRQQFEAASGGIGLA